MELVNLMYRYVNRFINSNELIKELKKIRSSIGNDNLNEEQADLLLEKYQRQLEERIKVFDFGLLEKLENKIENLTQLKDKNVCILNSRNEEHDKNKLNVL